jgi:hypothetical protein
MLLSSSINGLSVILIETDDDNFDLTGKYTIQGTKFV